MKKHVALVHHLDLHGAYDKHLSVCKLKVIFQTNRVSNINSQWKIAKGSEFWKQKVMLRA